MTSPLSVSLTHLDYSSVFIHLFWRLKLIATKIFEEIHQVLFNNMVSHRTKKGWHKATKKMLGNAFSAICGVSLSNKQGSTTPDQRRLNEYLTNPHKLSAIRSTTYTPKELAILVRAVARFHCAVLPTYTTVKLAGELCAAYGISLFPGFINVLEYPCVETIDSNSFRCSSVSVERLLLTLNNPHYFFDYARKGIVEFELAENFCHHFFLDLKALASWIETHQTIPIPFSLSNSAFTVPLQLERDKAFAPYWTKRNSRYLNINANDPIKSLSTQLKNIFENTANMVVGEVKKIDQKLRTPSPSMLPRYIENFRKVSNPSRVLEEHFFGAKLMKNPILIDRVVDNQELDVIGLVSNEYQAFMQGTGCREFALPHNLGS